jgi:hypothetical protein
MRETTKKRSGKAKNTGKVSNKRTDIMERAQIWSIDVLLAVVIFISIIMIFYVTLGANDNLSIKDLEIEASTLRVQLESNPALKIIEQDNINNTKLEEFTEQASTNYVETKEALGIKGDFCIYFEDEQGNLVLLADNRTGLGKGDVNITGTPCGEMRE